MYVQTQDKMGFFFPETLFFGKEETALYLRPQKGSYEATLLITLLCIAKCDLRKIHPG